MAARHSAAALDDKYQALSALESTSRRGLSDQQWPSVFRLGGVAVLCLSAFAAGRFSATPAPAAPFLPPPPSTASTEVLAGDTVDTWKLWTPRMLPIYRSEPLAKNIIRRFDLYLMNGATFDTGDFKARNVGQWLAPEFIYDTVGFPDSRTLRGWALSGEEQLYRRSFPTTGFSQMLFFGDDTHATTTTYGNAHWVHDLFGIPAPKEWTYFRVTDFYRIRKTGPGEGLVHYNFMMIDFADLFRRVGRPVLPPAALPEGLVLTAATNDGVPAPLSVVVAHRDSVAPRAAAVGALSEGWAGESTSAKWWHNDLTFYGPGGIGVARGTEEYQTHVLEPYRAAFTNRTVRTDMLFCEGNYCAAFGVLWGQHTGTWLGQHASHRMIGVRFAMHWRVVNGLIQEGWAIFDIPGFFSQLGLDFFALARAATADRQN